MLLPMGCPVKKMEKKDEWPPANQPYTLRHAVVGEGQGEALVKDRINSRTHGIPRNSNFRQPDAKEAPTEPVLKERASVVHSMLFLSENQALE